MLSIEPPSKEYIQDEVKGDANKQYPHAACISPGTTPLGPAMLIECQKG